MPDLTQIELSWDCDFIFDLVLIKYIEATPPLHDLKYPLRQVQFVKLQSVPVDAFDKALELLVPPLIGRFAFNYNLFRSDGAVLGVTYISCRAYQNLDQETSADKSLAVTSHCFGAREPNWGRSTVYEACAANNTPNFTRTLSMR